MGVEHHYGPVKQGEGDDGDFRDEPQVQYIQIPAKTPWWKLILVNFFAAAAGAGVMFLIAGGFFSKASSNNATPAATTSAVASSASSAAVTIPTSLADLIAEGNSDSPPNMLPGQILDCGHSPEAAREKGCVYDVMMQDWVPEPCYDSVLTEKYLAEGQYIWYADGDGNTTMSDAQMRKGEHGSAWMSTSYHKDHCVFSWMKIIRALRNNRGISQELISYDHVMHCAHGALTQNSDDTDLGVSAPTNYAKCALYNTWLKDPIPDKHDSTQKR